MLEMRCADLGIDCRGTVRGKTEDELLENIAEHAATKHGVPELNQTLVNYALKKVTGAPDDEDKA